MDDDGYLTKEDIHQLFKFSIRMNATDAKKQRPQDESPSQPPSPRLLAPSGHATDDNEARHTGK